MRNALTAALLMTTPALAQLGTVSDANATFTLVDVPDSPTAYAPRIVFSADPAINTIAHSFWWYYRLGGDVSESALNDSNGQLTSMQFGGGGIATLEWDDVDNRGIRAMYKISAESTGPTSGALIHTLTLENLTAAPIDIEAFAYCDIDHCDTAFGDTATGGPDRVTVNDASCPTGYAEFFGVRTSGYAVFDYPVVIDALVDGSQTDLMNVGLPFSTPSDFTAALQYSETALQPGALFTAVAVVGHNYSYAPCPAVPDTRSYGIALAGALGEPTIKTLAVPVVGTHGVLEIGNAPPNGTGTLLYGMQQLAGDLGVQAFGLTIYVATNSEPLTFDSTGSLVIPLNLPVVTGLCASDFYFQVLIQDPTSPAQFPITHTHAIEWTIGS